MALAAAIAAGFTGSCASSGFQADPNDGMKVLGDGRRGVVSMPWDAMDWRAAADRYCGAYGRFPKPTRVEPHQVKFECVDTLAELAQP